MRVSLIRRSSLAAFVLASVASTATAAVDVDKELWIRDLSVLEDPIRTVYVPNPPTPSHGAWTFGRLIENMCGPHNPSKFVEELFNEYAVTQVINGFKIEPRPFMLADVIEPWAAASKANGVDGFDFTIAPFVLTGIVNRIDLRGNGTYGVPSSGGEGRIIFSALDSSGFATRMTVIFEYELQADSCAEVLEWANRWHKLGSLPFGKEYNKALELIVNDFAGKNVAPGRPNGSALRQFRSNELVGEFPWQWREFMISGTTGLLEQVTVAQTPQTKLNGSKLLRDYVNMNEAAILNGTHVVPLTFLGESFRGGSSDGDPLTAFFAAPGILNNEARHIFSLNTCVACHTDETGTNFFQAGPRSLGQPTFLSGFLTGITVIDPVDPNKKRTFNDLKRRVEDLEKLLASKCIDLAAEKPLLRVH